MQINVAIQNENLVEQFTRFLCEELDITPHRIAIAPYECDDKVSGICVDQSETDYLILVRETGKNMTQVFCTIAHEMVHVKQYIKEDLGNQLDTLNHIPYHERWWELEAYSKAMPFVMKFVERVKNSCM